MADTCLFCHQPLRYDSLRVNDKRGYRGNGLFCTLRCGFDYAVAMVASRKEAQ